MLPVDDILCYGCPVFDGSCKDQLTWSDFSQLRENVIKSIRILPEVFPIESSRGLLGHPFPLPIKIRNTPYMPHSIPSFSYASHFQVIPHGSQDIW